MKIDESRFQDITLLRPLGTLDELGAQELERKCLALLDEGVRDFVIDFVHVDQLTGVGLRMLVTLGRTVEGTEGALVLCSLNEQASAVFEVSGLAQYFSFASSRQEALERLSSKTRPSRLSQLASRLLGDGKQVPSGVEPGRKSKGRSRLSTKVAEILSSGDDFGSKRIDKDGSKEETPSERGGGRKK
jgi:anti-anti-sigma factor